MSDFIQIPNSIATRLNSRSKHSEALTYAIIRNEIKDHTLQASIAQAQLANLLQVDERTAHNYVAALKEKDFFTKIEKKQGENVYPYNVYTFPPLTQDYFILLPQLLDDPNLSPKQKGILLFIKACCWKGTNYLPFRGKTTDLAQQLGIGKNQITSHLQALERTGSIRFIQNTLHILHPAFPLHLKQEGTCGIINDIYQTIYQFCLDHDRIPPYKQLNQRGIDPSLSILAAHYADTPSQLLHDLNTRCTHLPPNLSLNYFCQLLRNNTAAPEPARASLIL